MGKIRVYEANELVRNRATGEVFVKIVKFQGDSQVEVIQYTVVHGLGGRVFSLTVECL